MTRADENRVNVLQRRADYLVSKVVSESAGTSPWNLKEIDALHWAIRLFEVADEAGILAEASILRDED